MRWELKDGVWKGSQIDNQKGEMPTQWGTPTLPPQKQLLTDRRPAWALSVLGTGCVEGQRRISPWFCCHHSRTIGAQRRHWHLRRK